MQVGGKIIPEFSSDSFRAANSNQNNKMEWYTYIQTQQRQVQTVIVDVSTVRCARAHSSLSTTETAIKAVTQLSKPGKVNLFVARNLHREKIINSWAPLWLHEEK